MALTDILFDVGIGEDFIVEVPAGTLNSPEDILFDDNIILEIGPSYVNPELIAEAIWTYDNRQLTS